MLWNKMNDMGEEYGHIPDAFHLSQEEIETLRKSKKEMTEIPIGSKWKLETIQRMENLFLI